MRLYALLVETFMLYWLNKCVLPVHTAGPGPNGKKVRSLEKIPKKIGEKEKKKKYMLETAHLCMRGV